MAKKYYPIQMNKKSCPRCPKTGRFLSTQEQNGGSFANDAFVNIRRATRKNAEAADRPPVVIMESESESESEDEAKQVHQHITRRQLIAAGGAMPSKSKSAAATERKKILQLIESLKKLV